MKRVAQEIGSGIASPESGNYGRAKNDGFVRIGVDMILNLEILKAALPKEDASDGASGAGATRQISLDLEDWW